MVVLLAAVVGVFIAVYLFAVFWLWGLLAAGGLVLLVVAFGSWVENRASRHRSER